jgi:hypothetical protein
MSFGTQSKKKDKERVRVSLEKIIPGNLERNFLKRQVRNSATVEGLALGVPPRTSFFSCHLIIAGNNLHGW